MYIHTSKSSYMLCRVSARAASSGSPLHQSVAPPPLLPPCSRTSSSSQQNKYTCTYMYIHTYSPYNILHLSTFYTHDCDIPSTHFYVVNAKTCITYWEKWDMCILVHELTHIDTTEGLSCHCIVFCKHTRMHLLVHTAIQA